MTVAVSAQVRDRARERLAAGGCATRTPPEGDPSSPLGHGQASAPDVLPSGRWRLADHLKTTEGGQKALGRRLVRPLLTSSTEIDRGCRPREDASLACSISAEDVPAPSKYGAHGGSPRPASAGRPRARRLLSIQTPNFQPGRAFRFSERAPGARRAPGAVRAVPFSDFWRRFEDMEHGGGFPGVRHSLSTDGTLEGRPCR